MNVTTRTTVVHHHFIEIDGVEYGTTLPADEYIDPKVETEGNRTTITYAARDGFPDNPRDYHACGTMVRVRDGYNGIDIDQPDGDVATAYRAGTELADDRFSDTEVYYLVKCGCAWDGHSLESVMEGECNFAYEALVVGNDDELYSDGSGGLDLMDGYEIDLDSLEGVAAMLAVYLDTYPYASAGEIAKAYLEVTRPDITAFIEWTFTGYSQGDWAEGYAYMTHDDFEDPEAALRSEVEEYAAWANGDVYLAVQETYIDGESDDYQCIGGYYGEQAIENAIKNGDF